MKTNHRASTWYGQFRHGSLLWAAVILLWHSQPTMAQVPSRAPQAQPVAARNARSAPAPRKRDGVVKNGDNATGKRGGVVEKRGGVVEKRDGVVEKRGGVAQPTPGLRRQAPASKEPPLPALPAFKGRMSLAKLMAAARQQHPALLRMRQMVRVFKEREKRAAPWPDLTVGVAMSNFPLDSFNPTTTAMSGIEYSISQRFPILQRLSIQRKLSTFDTAITKALIQEKLVGIRFQLQRAMLELAYLRRAMALEREEYQLMRQAAAVARMRYVVNKAPQQHLLEALTAQAQIRNEMTRLVSLARIWRHRLSLWTGQGSQAALQSVPAFPEHKDMLTWPSPKTLVTRGLNARGAALRWKLAAQKAKTLLAFAKVRYWPDVTVQLSVRQRFPNPLDNGAPFLSLGLKVPIPSWGNAARHGLVKEAMALHVYAARQRKELQANWLSQAQIASSEAQQYLAQRRIASQQTIPLALQSYQSALANYQVGRVSFLTLIASLKIIFRERRKLHRLDANRAIALARLQAIAGVVK